MKYKQLIDNIRYIAENHNLVSTFEEGDDIFKLNYTDTCYPVVFLTPNEHNLNIVTNKYNFTLYFIDRQLEDGSNRLDIHSTAIKVINDIWNAINLLHNTEVNGEVILTLFNDKISDICAGAWATISIETMNPESDCNTLLNDVAIISESNNPIISENNNTLITE